MAGRAESVHERAAGAGIDESEAQQMPDGGQANTSPEAEAAQFQSGPVVSISLGHAIHDTYTGFLPPLLPVFIANFALTNTQAGLLSVFMQAPSLIQPVIGRAADRLDFSRIIVVAPILTAVAMSLLGPAPSYAVLAGLLLIAGLSSAGFHAIAPVVAGRASGHRLGRGMGFWMVGGELGRVLGPLVIVTTVRFLTVRGTPWLMIPGFIGALAIWRYYGRASGQRNRPQVVDSRAWHQAFRGKAKGLVPIVGIVIVRACLTAALEAQPESGFSENILGW